LTLIDVVHRWFCKRKHTLCQWTGWCAVFSGNVRDWRNRSDRQFFSTGRS